MSSGKINAPTAGAVAAICLSAAWAVNGLFDTFSPAPNITEVTNENHIEYPETDAAMAALLENPKMLEIFRAAAICNGTFRINPSVDRDGVPNIAVSVEPNIYAQSNAHSSKRDQAEAFSNCAFNILAPESGITME